MIAGAEARPHDAAGERLAHQELLRALSGLVVVVDDAVVGRLEAVEFPGLAADRQRREQHLVLGVGGRRLVVAGVEHVEGVARLRLVLEIDVVGVDADQALDHRARNLVAQRGLVDALVEPHALAVVLVVVGGVGDQRCSCWRRRPRRSGPVGQRDHGVDRAVAQHDDADRLQARGDSVAATRMRSFWPSFRPLSRPRGPSAAAIAAISSGVAPSSLRMVAMLSPFLTVTMRSFQALPPVIWCAVFGSSVMFSGTMRASKPA